MNKIKKIQSLNQQIEKCKKCPLWKSRQKPVPGEGPLNAKLMIIGQAPGREESKTGRPFVGRAGKLLDELLEIAGIKRENVFITSTTKCFPPENRKPTKEEIKLCLPYLKKQIEIINPRKIILLGTIAFSLFFPNKHLKDFRGKWIKRERKFYFLTYHPAAGLRFSKIKKILKEDFRKIRKN